MILGGLRTCVRDHARGRHRRLTCADAVPTTYEDLPGLAWLDVVPVPTGRYQPRHRLEVTS